MDFIYTAEHALPDALCDELIARFESHPGKTPGSTGGGVDRAKKSSLDLTIDRFPDLRDIRGQVLDVCLNDLTAYFMRYPFVGSINPTITNTVTGIRTEITMDNVGSMPAEALQMSIRSLFHCGEITILKYTPAGDGYPHWHCEIFPDAACDSLHRVLLWMYYLNDVETGGETEFYFQQRRIQPRKGTVVIAPAGFTHTHRGNMPVSGNKYIIASWLLFNRAGKAQAG